MGQYSSRLTCFKGFVIGHEFFLLTLAQTTNFRLVQMKELADDYFMPKENGRKFSESVENMGWKRRNCWLCAISPFPIVF